MRLFLKKILIFALIIIVFLAMGEVVVRHIATPYSYKYGYIKERGGEIATLVLGSSHTYYGIIPSELGDSVFNLANISQTPEYDFQLLKEYEPYMPHLRKVIIPISYFTFRDPKLEELDRGLCVQYKVGMELNLHPDLSIYNLALTDFKSYTGRLRNMILPEESNRCDSLGFGLGFGLDHRDPAWREKAEARVEELTFATPGRADEVYRVLQSMIEYCDRRGIECVFVTTPVSKEFRQYADKAQYAEMADYASVLKGMVDGRYFDFYSSAAFDDEDFHDVDHLSDVGARKFSRLLRESMR